MEVETMRKPKLSGVLVLTLVFMLMLSSAVMAAPEGSKIISNELEGTFNLTKTALEKGIESTTFSMRVHSGVKGYILDTRFSNATLKEIEGLTASLYKGDTLLMTNTANIDNIAEDYPDNTKITSPFDVFGDYDYKTEGYWNNSGWAEGISKLIKPNKAVIEVEFTDGTTATIEDTNLVEKENIFPTVGVTAQDFGVFTAVLGYNVGFELNNATVEDVKSIEVSIYNDETCLQTNTAIMQDFRDEYPNSNQLSTPIKVFGNTDYKRFWTSTGWNQEVSELTIPNKAVIKVTFENDTTAIATNENFTGEISEIIPEELITLTWDADNKFEKDDNGAYTVNVDETNSFDISVTASSKYLIENVLFIIEVVGDNNFTAIADDGQELGFDENGFWFWGQKTGFTFARETVTTDFKVTAEPGTYKAKIYAVQLQ